MQAFSEGLELLESRLTGALASFRFPRLAVLLAGARDLAERVPPLPPARETAWAGLIAAAAALGCHLAAGPVASAFPAAVAACCWTAALASALRDRRGKGRHRTGLTRGERKVLKSGAGMAELLETKAGERL
jgi:hypothetical protein